MRDELDKEASGAMTLPSLGFEAVMEMQRPALTAMVKLNNRLYENVSAINKEWALFINRRLEEDLMVAQQLAECKTGQDVFGVYAQFFQNACSHYQSGLEQMTELGRSIAENALQPLQSRSEDTRQMKR